MSRRILSLHSALLITAIGALALTIVALGAPARTQLASAAASAPQRLLVIAVDGLGWEAFELAKRRGMFKQFQFAGRHVAPYPSMSHPSWNEVVGARRVFGARGNAHTIEARWFDLSAMRVADDPRQVIARQTSLYAYQRVWDYYFDPLMEPLQYLPGRKLFDRELAEAERAILEEFKGDRFIAYVGGLDAMAHTHRNELWPYLQRFDAMISRVVDSLAARGDEPELWLVSDHGNAGGFAEGAPERYLTTVSLDRAIKRAGLTKSDTGRLERADQVSVVTIALATMVNVYFADMSRRRALAASALAEPGVEMATWLEVNGGDRHVVILSATGEARLRWRGSAYSYERIRGNPLLIPDSLVSEAGTLRWIPDPVMRAATVWGPYPDAPFRLMQSAIKQVENAPDLIVNLRDGFAYQGDLGRFARMVRTHGSLNARPSLGVIATSARSIPTHVRSEEVLGVIGISPESLFTRVASLQPEGATPLARARLAASGAGWVPTGKDDESYDMRFLRRARPLALSLDYFQKDAMLSLLDAVSAEGKSSRFSRSRDIVRRADVLGGIANNVDTLLALADSLDSRAISARFRQAEKRVSEIPELAPLADLRAVWEGEPSKGLGRGAAVRRGAMAMWTLPYFLDAALAAPEWDSIPDTRDARFALQWRSGLRDKVVADPSRLLDDTTVAPRLFAEAYAERRLSRAIEPATMPLLYDPDVSSVTVVYIPGIYDELFDHEIWSRGMRSLPERLGVRTVTIPVDGRCSSSINADRIVASLRDDTRRRLERGYATPRYLILGYSKGGVDATEALARAPDLAREQVAALVSIATPHRGTAVAERSDVPGAVMKWTVSSPRPAACDTSTASQSLWPATRAAFWVAKDGGRLLAPLTRYFSLSFVVEADRAHPWMKVTKQIGQFREQNDGVVTLSASRFPTPMHAVNLGVIEADHIAGRLASDFPQDAFFQAIVVAVAELGALEPAAGEQWRHVIAARDASLWQGLRRWYAGDEAAERVPAFPASLRAASTLPGGATGWTPDRTFRMGNVDDFADVPVREMTPSRHPNGLRFRCDQRNMQALRREYEFYYDAGNGGSEDDATNGYSIVAAPGRASQPGGRGEGARACLLATQASAMKMTTVAYRFRPRDFPSLRIRLRVEKGVTGADVGKTGLGKNDATFKLWVILRDTRPSASGRIVLLAYTWAAPNTRGKVPLPGAVYEARSSRRNVVLTTLPEAWVVAIGGPGVEGDWHTVEQDMAKDLARAFPQIPVGALQVVGITLQSDSDDSRGASKVYLESLDIGTQPVPGRMALVKGAM